jgi:AcrR family transcriptional regulator
MARGRATDTGALMVAASQVFVEKGYRSATIDDIAEAAGISRPTVYKYTKSKQHLLDLMVDEIRKSLGKDLAAALADGTSRERLRAYLDVHVYAFRANRAFYAIVFSEEVELSPRGRRRFREWAHTVTTDFCRLVEELLEESPRRGTVDPVVLANMLLSMLTSLHRWYDPDGPMDEARLAQELYILVLSALQVPHA